MRPCKATALVARGILPGDEQLLLFKHEGKHTCTSLRKKCKHVPVPATEDAVRAALPGSGAMSTERLKIGATANVFNKMLTGQENTTLEDVLTVAEAVQDPRTLDYVVKGSKSSVYSPHKDNDVEITQMKKRLEELGLRALLFDRLVKFVFRFYSPCHTSQVH